MNILKTSGGEQVVGKRKKEKVNKGNWTLTWVGK